MVGTKVLQCSHCEMECGTRVESQLVLPTCGGAQISNKNGVLTVICSPQLPNGTFASSCSGCTTINEILQCSVCVDEANIAHESSIALSACKVFANRNGILGCEEVVPKEFLVPRVDNFTDQNRFSENVESADSSDVAPLGIALVPVLLLVPVCVCIALLFCRCFRRPFHQTVKRSNSSSAWELKEPNVAHQ